MAKTEQSTSVALCVLLESGMDCFVSFCYKRFGSHSLGAAVGTFKDNGERFKFPLMAAIELFLANLSIKLVTDGWM